MAKQVEKKLRGQENKKIKIFELNDNKNTIKT